MNNGNEIKAYPFKVYLELKPKVQAKIIELKIIRHMIRMMLFMR